MNQLIRGPFGIEQGFVQIEDTLANFLQVLPRGAWHRLTKPHFLQINPEREVLPFANVRA